MQLFRTFFSRTFRSLSIANYRYYFVGQAVSLSGNWMQTIGLGWLVIVLTDSGTQLGVIVGLIHLPLLLFGMWGGAIADRFPKRRILYITQTLLGALSICLSVLVYTNAIELWMLYVFALTFGVVRAFDDAARHSFIYELVGPEHLKNAVSLNSTENNLGRVIGPTIAGLLIAGVNIAFCFLFNGLSFLFGVFMLSRMDGGAFHLKTKTGEGRLRGQVMEGLRYVRGNPLIRNTLLMIAVIGTLTFEFQVSLPLIAEGVFSGDATSYAYLMTMMGVGAICGGLVAASRHAVAPRMLVVMSLCFGASIVLTALMPTLLLTGLGMTVVGFFAINTTSLANTMIQLEAAPHMRGRVMSLWTMAMAGSTPIGGPIVGLIAEHAGPRFGLLIGGIAAIFAGSVAATSLLRRDRTAVVPPYIEVESAEASSEVKL